MVEECISLEIAAAKMEETEIIMDLLPTIGSTIQTLQGIKCDKHLQSMNVLAFAPNLLDHCPLQDMNSFLQFYQVHHSLDAILSRMLITTDESYPSDEMRTAAFHIHVASLQHKENKGIEAYKDCLKSILITPTVSYKKQVEENNHCAT